MRSFLKLLLYTALVGAAYWLGFRAFGDYSLLMTEDSTAATRRITLKSAWGTNAPPEGTAKPTNAPAAVRVESGDSSEGEGAGDPMRNNRRVGRHFFRLLTNGTGFAAALVLLGFVAAHDFGHLLRFRFGKEIQFVDARSERKADYEKAEYVLLRGQPLEAIRLLTAHVEKYPNQAHAVVRIAEIYDKELEDFRAAALQYQVALKLKLPPEKWGWIAVRLSNLYTGKLNQPREALALLRRLVAEYPDTQAAEKARKRLTLLDAGGTG